MDDVKNLLAVLVAIIGVFTALLTFYAKYLDIKKASATAAAETPKPAHTVLTSDAPPLDPLNPYAAPDARYVPPESAFAFMPGRPDPSTILKARATVRGPAISIIVMGILSLITNLSIALFGFVDEFVMPITDEAKMRHAAMENPQRPGPFIAATAPKSSTELSPEATVILTDFTLLGLAMASAAAIWAGVGMLRLRSYWLSVAGCFAIMAGATLTCCMTGVPVGVWGLYVLYKPEVAGSVR